MGEKIKLVDFDINDFSHYFQYSRSSNRINTGSKQSNVDYSNDTF